MAKILNKSKTKLRIEKLLFIIFFRKIWREDEILGIKKEIVVKPRPIPNYPENYIYKL
jgi:hypothetical protein